VKSKLITSLLLLLVVSAGSFLSRHFGWYSTYFFTDIILHTLSGIMFGYLWLAFINKSNISSLITFSTIILFAVFGSFLWEVWEYGGYVFFPAHVEFYKPEIGDSLGDIASGMLGGILAGVINFFGTRKINK
jgi:hypothetical protein